ncbi:hypothetical protein ACFU96_44195 [Streptomyces sp. NPDC057620]|uniref:hypothetical protein n=1 Tax=Streptomyces sp. NPDC057620 TaxID=3346185 RepID=UPI0036AE4F9A
MITPDPATPEGAAIIDLHARMQDFKRRTGERPVADPVDILSEWLDAFDFQTPPAPEPYVAGSVWMLRREDHHGHTVTLWADEASALAFLAQYARARWDRAWGAGTRPGAPPADDRAAVELYYGPEDERGNEYYWLTLMDIRRLPPGTLTLPGFRFPGREFCDQVNSTAVFHPRASGTGPCIEVGGVLVFAYLDPDTQAVQVSVHLDTAIGPLVRHDETVPLHVQVGDATVFSAGAGPVPARTWARRPRRLAGRMRRRRRQRGIDAHPS